MIFEDRLQAAQLLLLRLEKYKEARSVVLAVPRGAVPMGAFLAEGLSGSLNLVPVRKVFSPLAPEFALGAADVEGNFYPDENVRELPQEQLRNWFKKSLETLRHRDFRWRQMLPRQALKDRVVIIVDDGVATGATMRAALMWVRRKEPKHIVVAVPVSSREAAALLYRLADEVICLQTPSLFSSVSEFYLRFDEVTDDEVCSILSSLQKNAAPFETSLEH